MKGWQGIGGRLEFAHLDGTTSIRRSNRPRDEVYRHVDDEGFTRVYIRDAVERVDGEAVPHSITSCSDTNSPPPAIMSNQPTGLTSPTIRPRDSVNFHSGHATMPVDKDGSTGKIVQEDTGNRCQATFSTRRVEGDGEGQLRTSPLVQRVYKAVLHSL
jgi:hypothetical protein